MPQPRRIGAIPGFNEAACNTGGTPMSDMWWTASSGCFNEAACNTGGTRRMVPAGCQGGPESFNEAACNTGGTLGSGR